MGINFNPFKKDKDELDRQFDHQDNQLNKQMAMETSTEEQLMMQGGLVAPDLTKWQQNLDPLIDKMVHRLKRMVLDNNGTWKSLKIFVDSKEQVAPPLCSDECIYKLVATIEPNASQNLMMAKLTEEEIAKRMYSLEANVLLDILIPEHQQYGTDLRDLSTVKQIFRSCARPTFFRAIGGFEAKNNREIRSVKELHSQGFAREPKKKGLFEV